MTGLLVPLQMAWAGQPFLAGSQHAQCMKIRKFQLDYELAKKISLMQRHKLKFGASPEWTVTEPKAQFCLLHTTPALVASVDIRSRPLECDTSRLGATGLRIRHRNALFEAPYTRPPQATRCVSLQTDGEKEAHIQTENPSEKNEARMPLNSNQEAVQGKKNAVQDVKESHSLSRRQIISSVPLATASVIVGEASGLAGCPRAQALTGGLNVTTARDMEKDRAVSTALGSLRDRVSAFTLPNGMRWIVAERHNAPIVACHTYADVGAADEVDGLTGLAHLLEHLAFKGTRLVGTRNPEAEVALLEQLDEVFYERLAAEEAGNGALVRRLSDKFERLQREAAELAVPNEYGALLGRQGGVGLNAQTSQDSTEYYVSLPANKVELWMALESGRFRAPVFRELYAEKEVVKEERRLRVDNAPLGRFTEAFAQMAFPGSPYARPIIGYPEDFEKIGRREVESFFRQRYTPRSLTCAVVGDVNPREVERMALKYFGEWEAPAGAQPAGLPSRLWRGAPAWDALPSLPKAPQALRMSLSASPFYMEGYYRPGAASTDDPALSVLSSVLSGSRTSRFYKNLVSTGKVLSATAVESYPGDKRPCLMLLYGIPASGSTTDDVASLLQNELEEIAANGVSEEELVPIRKSARASLLEVFGGNEGLAKLLCQYEAQAGSWEGLLQESSLLEAVTPADVQRVASLLCRPGNRVAGHVRTTMSPFFPIPLTQ